MVLKSSEIFTVITCVKTRISSSRRFHILLLAYSRAIHVDDHTIHSLHYTTENDADCMKPF